MEAVGPLLDGRGLSLGALGAGSLEISLGHVALQIDRGGRRRPFLESFQNGLRPFQN